MNNVLKWVLFSVPFVLFVIAILLVIFGGVFPPKSTCSESKRFFEPTNPLLEPTYNYTVCHQKGFVTFNAICFSNPKKKFPCSISFTVSVNDSTLEFDPLTQDYLEFLTSFTNVRSITFKYSATQKDVVDAVITFK
jgi:hypothetical protein